MSQDFKKSYEKKLATIIKKKKVKEVSFFEIEDIFFEKKIKSFLKKKNVYFNEIKSPMFLTSREEFKKYLKENKKPFMAKFYKINRSKLNILYQSNIFKNFLKGVLNLKDIYPYSDTLSSINYNYYQKSQQLGWHFDNASFAITLMIQSSDKGGEFEYVSKGRNFSENYINKSYIKDILDRKILPQKADVDSGTLILFYGRNYLHRVTPVESEKPRILVTLNYNEEEGTMLSENARLTFFGRIN